MLAFNLDIFVDQFLFPLNRMVLSDYTKLRILSLYWPGFKISKIVDILVLENATVVSRQFIQIFLKHFTECSTIGRKPGSGLTLKLLPTILQIIEFAMQEDDKITTTELQAKLAAHGCYISLTTILHNCHQIGWVYRGSAHCQLIRMKINRGTKVGSD